MRWPILIITVSLIFAYWQDSLPARMAKRWPEMNTKYIDPFISNNYEWYDDKGVVLVWWVKYCCNDLQLLIVTVCLTKLAHYVSRRLFLVGVVYCLYCLSDHAMLWYDYKTTSNAYHFLDVAGIINVVLIFTVKEKKQGAIKSIK